MVDVMDKYKVTKSNQKVHMLIVGENQDTFYAQLILDELSFNSPDFDKLCDSPKVGMKGKHKKEVHLHSVESDGLCGKCRECGVVCRYLVKECKKVQRKCS